jgi:hypothetical protein
VSNRSGRAIGVFMKTSVHTILQSVNATSLAAKT